MLNNNTSARQAAVINLSITFKRTEYKESVTEKRILRYK